MHYLCRLLRDDRLSGQKLDQNWLIDKHLFEAYLVNAKSSAGRRYQGKISKCGSAGLRLMLFRIGLNISQYCRVITRAKQRTPSRGKRSMSAIFHAAPKANRINFHILTHQISFDPLLAF